MISLYQARDSFAELDTFGDDIARAVWPIPWVWTFLKP